ncbi:MAG: sensor histidine kinase [Desulfomonilaceae bacterium]
MGRYRALRNYIPSLLILLSAAPLYLRAGPVFALGALSISAVSVYVTRHLINEYRKARDQNRILEEQLAKAQKLAPVDELSAGVAHEINNPLGIISQEVQLIKDILTTGTTEQFKENVDLNDSVNEISLQVDRCKEIVNKLLSFARDMKPVIQRVELNALIDNIAALVKKEATAKQIRIYTKFQSGLPTVYSDPPLLRQIILNLLVNATQAIDGSGEITISTNTGNNGTIEIAVEDTGCGIPEENLDKIFTPFFSTKTSKQGSGLGLAFCRGIIEKLGGSISVVSEIGKWTIFTVRIPIDSRMKGEIY